MTQGTTRFFTLAVQARRVLLTFLLLRRSMPWPVM